ncbi:MAG: CPBP family intramembrane metalloprotease, partial [Paracoccaceae bacterium]|nr:CPBP family intramembrane metalloprotease [Paracoccaceae bacterium]
MTEPAVLPASRDVPDAVLGPYLLVTFGIAWAVLGLYIFLPEPMSRLFGAISGSHPLFVLAVWAPAIAAFALVLWTGGAQGLRRYLSRLTLWHCPWGWALFLLL